MTRTATPPAALEHLADQIAGTATPGDLFVNSASYKALLADGIPTVPSMSVRFDAVRVGSLKALLTDPHLTPPTQVFAPPAVPVLDLLAAITVVDNESSLVDVYRASLTNEADVYIQGGDTPKPESTLEWTEESLNTETLAHHLPVTTRTLRSKNNLRALIDAHLAGGVRAKVQTQVAAMLATATNVQTQTFTTDVRTTLRLALTKAQKGGAEVGAVPTGILISADDAEDLDLEHLAEPIPSLGLTPIPPFVVSAALPAGLAYVGALTTITVYTDGEVTTNLGYIDDQFTHNSRTILSEVDAVSTVITGPAIVRTHLSDTDDEGS